MISVDASALGLGVRTSEFGVKSLVLRSSRLCPVRMRSLLIAFELGDDAVFIPRTVFGCMT